MFTTTLLSAAAAVMMIADISPKNSLSIKGRYVDVSISSNIVAVVTPGWRGERFNDQSKVEITREGNKVSSTQVDGANIDDFKLDEFSADTEGNKTIITLKATLKKDLPTRMFYQAMMIPDYLLANTSYTAIMEDGKEVSGIIPDQPENPSTPVELLNGFNSVTFDGYYGKISIKKISGPSLIFFERRADSVYNPIRGFEVGARWDVEFEKPIESVIELIFEEKELTPAKMIAPRVDAPADKIKINNLVETLSSSFGAVPKPKQRKIENGTPFFVCRGISFTIDGVEGAELERLQKAVVRVLNPYFEGISTTPDSRSATPEIEIIITGSEENPDAYTITVSENKIVIDANSARGAFYAAQTLKMQINEGEIPQMFISDWPDYEIRGIHLLLDEDSVDVSGPMIENLFAPLKINTLVTECQYVKWDTTKNIHQPWGATKEQVKQLKQIAEDNYMEFIPLFQTLGHSEWLFANGQNRDLAEDPDFPYAYNPFAPGLYPLIDSILDEVLDTFGNPKRFHIGHDEVFNPSAKWPCRPENIERGAKEIFRHDTMHFYNIAKQRNMEMLMWHDMLLTPEECEENGAGGAPDNIWELRKDLPKDINMVFWRYTAGFPYTDITKVYNEGFTKLIGATWYDRANIVDICKFGKDKMRGMIQTTWTGYNGNAVAVRKEFMQMHPYAQLAISSWDSGLTLKETDSARIFCDLMEETRQQKNSSGWSIDISGYANVEINPEQDVFLSGKIYGLEKLPLPGLRAGAVNFRIAEYNGHPAAVTVKSRIAPNAPEKSASIPVNLKASQLFFLHSTISAMPKYGAETAKYKVVYEDGSMVYVPVIFGLNIGALNSSINFDLAPLRSFEWKDDGADYKMWSLAWDNPNPEKQIRSVSLEANESQTPIYWFGLSAAE